MPLLDPKENPGDSPRHSETPYDVLWVQGGGRLLKGLKILLGPPAGAYLKGLLLFGVLRGYPA